MSKIKFFTQATLTLLISVGMSYAFADSTPAVPLDRIVAVINDSVVTQSELNQSIDTIKKQMAASNVTVPLPDVLQKQVLDQLINKKLQLQVAEHMGINATEKDVESAIGNIAKSNKISTTDLYEKVKEQDIKISDYKKEIRDQLTIQQVQQQAVASKINISQQEVDDFLRSKAWKAFHSQEYHLEDILITLPENPSPQDVVAAKKRADEVLVKLNKGSSFSDVAAAESGNANALQGGDLGWRKLPEVPAIFSNELIHMKTGELLGPIQTPNGYHIVKLIGIRKVTNTLNLTQRNQQVRELIFQRKFEEGLQSWLSKVRSEAFINTHPEK